MFPALILGSVLVLSLILFGVLGKYRNGIPLVSTCSAAISAACHRPRLDNEAHMFQVQWGVVSEDEQSRIGHCSLTTARDVTKDSKPKAGYSYA